MIRKVRIQNFKSLRDVSIDLERFTVFVGANGSGKTSVLEAIHNAVRAATGLPVPTKEVGRRAGDPARLIASYERATEHLGWTPTADLSRIVTDAWDFHRAQMERRQ